MRRLGNSDSTGPCMAGSKNLKAKNMTESDLIRCLAIRATNRSTAIRVNRCDCVLKNFSQHRHLYHSSMPSNTILLDVQNKEQLHSLFFAQPQDQLSSFLENQLLPLYWSNDQHPQMRIEILSLLLESTFSSSLDIALGASNFAESVSSCVCRESKDFRVLSDEEADLLNRFVSNVCTVIDDDDHQNSNRCGHKKCEDSAPTEFSGNKCDRFDASSSLSEKENSDVVVSCYGSMNTPTEVPTNQKGSSGNENTISSTSLDPDDAENNNNNNKFPSSARNYYSTQDSDEAISKRNSGGLDEDAALLLPKKGNNYESVSSLSESSSSTLCAVAALYQTLGQAFNSIDLS